MSIDWCSILTALTLAIVSYPHIRRWIKRPKVELTWFLKAEKELGVWVENKGKNAAEKVHGEVMKDNKRIPIQWESDSFGHDQGAVFVDIRTGIFNRRSFSIYIPSLDVKDVRKKDISRITIKLSWEYHGITKTKNYKIPPDVFENF